MKFTAIYECSRYIEVEIDAPDLDMAIDEARDIENGTTARPELGFAPEIDYYCVRIDFADPETGKDTEAYLS